MRGFFASLLAGQSPGVGTTSIGINKRVGWVILIAMVAAVVMLTRILLR